MNRYTHVNDSTLNQAEKRLKGNLKTCVYFVNKKIIARQGYDSWH